jgi:hemolysin D
MISEPEEGRQQPPSSLQGRQANPKVITLRPPSRWHDPLNLIQINAPAKSGRIVLWTLSLLMLFVLLWATFGELDIIVAADGKLTPQTLVKIVQPAEAGVLKELLVNEGESVKKGQTLARLDRTVTNADLSGASADLSTQQLQLRRVEAELAATPLQMQANDDPLRFAEVARQYDANQKAFRDSLDQEKALLVKAEQEMRSAIEIERKFEQTLPNYAKAAAAYSKLEKEGFLSSLAADEKRREALEKEKDLASQNASVAALAATVLAQQKKLNQVQNIYQSGLQKELSDLRNRIQRLQPEMDKAAYREGLMELKAPQDGIIVEIATTTIGAVVKPGDVLLTLVPKDERLVASVNIRNEDVGFIRANQAVQIKLAAYPFQKYGMLSGTVVHIAADATSATQSNVAMNSAAGSRSAESNPSYALPAYKATIEVPKQFLDSPSGERLQLSTGMHITAEIHQGKRTVLDYLLSPVKKVVQEAGREK